MPTATPPAAARSNVTATPAYWSASSWTVAACRAIGAMTRPTTPFTPMTAMSGSTPSSLPRSTVTVSTVGMGLPAITRAASVGAGWL